MIENKTNLTNITLSRKERKKIKKKMHRKMKRKAAAIIRDNLEKQGTYVHIEIV